MQTHECAHRLFADSPVTRPLESAAQWWARHVEASADSGAPIHAAMLGGFAADRLGYAFASGYTAALRQLLGDGVASVRRALCATESGGGHPRAIQSKLTVHGDGSVVLSGHKAFVTLGHLADELLIVASVGVDAGRNRLRCVQLPASRAGLRFEALPQTSFVPEIPHGALHMESVAVHAGELLPGDGYERVLKPFRTIEDAHVFGALLGYLIRIGREAAWPDETLERLLGFALALIPIARTNAPLDPAIHLALAAVISGVRDELAVLESSDAWSGLDEATRDRWARDRRLLDVAGKARARRLETARAAFPRAGRAEVVSAP